MNHQSAFQPIINYIKTTQPGGFFVTGTDTDIGKTFVSCELLKQIRQKQPGLVVSVRKPIASGAIFNDSGQLYSEDAQQLQQAAGDLDPMPQICRYLFEEPISPARAILQAVNRGEHKPIHISHLFQACQVPEHHFALVEGAGGIYSPLALDGLNIDLAKRLGYPVILVVGNKLGCINHALLSINAIEQAQLKLAHIFINDLSADADQDTIHELAKLTNYPITQIVFRPNPFQP